MASVDGPSYFTLDEANSSIPELRTLFERIFQIRPQLAASYKRLEDAGHTLERGDFEGTEQSIDLDEVEDDVAREYGRFRALAEALRDDISAVQTTGCTIKDLTSGLVDWPTLHRGREVYLCWRYGEDRIEFWHEIEDGFAGRKPVTELIFER